MIVIVKNTETDQKHAYFDIDRIVNETIFKKTNLFILEGYSAEGSPRAKLFYKDTYEITEAINDCYSISDEEIVKEDMHKNLIVIHNCL